jgi:uncharacterized membrane protein
MFAVSGVVIAQHPSAGPLLVVPVMATLIWMLFAAAPRIMPRGRNLLRAESAYGTLWLAATSLLSVVFGITVARVLGSHPIQSIFVGAMGVFLIVAGNFTGKLEPNRFAGVRTPWALADDEIWDKTQRLGGWCLVIAGFITINATLLLDPKTAKRVMLASLLTVLAIVMLASWNWARLKRRTASGK